MQWLSLSLYVVFVLGLCSGFVYCLNLFFFFVSTLLKYSLLHMVTELKGSVVIGTFRVVQPSPQAVLVFSESYIEWACLWSQQLGMLGQKDLEPKEFWPAQAQTKLESVLSYLCVPPSCHSSFPLPFWW